MNETTDNRAATLHRLRRFARVLDSSIRLPGGFTIGLNGLIGLIPGIGDVIASVLTAWTVLVGVRLRVPASILFRMLLNVLMDFLIGIVPVLGDLADFVYKANERNVRLLEAYYEAPQPTTVRSRLLLGAVLSVLGAIVLAAVAIGFMTVRFLLSLAVG